MLPLAQLGKLPYQKPVPMKERVVAKRLEE